MLGAPATHRFEPSFGSITFTPSQPLQRRKRKALPHTEERSWKHQQKALPYLHSAVPTAAAPRTAASVVSGSHEYLQGQENAVAKAVTGQ